MLDNGCGVMEEQEDRRQDDGGRRQAAEGREQKAEGGRRQAARDNEPMLYCPACSTRLTELKCKLVCNQCGYYMSCADYY